MRMSLFAASLVSVLSVGCASIAVTDDGITESTTRAIGLNASEFVISDRRNSGLKTTYRVKTNSGTDYSCLVSGTFSITGRAVSEALCTEMVDGAQATAKSEVSCNALLKAAGRC